MLHPVLVCIKEESKKKKSSTGSSLVQIFKSLYNKEGYSSTGRQTEYLGQCLFFLSKMDFDPNIFQSIESYHKQENESGIFEVY